MAKCEFKVLLEEWPAIFQFNDQFFIEVYDIDEDKSHWAEITKETAERQVKIRTSDDNVSKKPWSMGECTCEGYEHKSCMGNVYVVTEENLEEIIEKSSCPEEIIRAEFEESKRNGKSYHVWIRE